MDTTINGLKKPYMSTDAIDDVVDAVSTNAVICDSQFTTINQALQIGTDKSVNLQGATIWGTESVINFAPKGAQNQAQIISYSDNQSPGNIFIQPQNYFVIRSLFSNASTNVPVNGTLYGTLNIVGNLGVSGAKNRLVQTKNYGQVGMNAMESTECWFHEIQENKLINGQCRINLDKKYLETINTTIPYQVRVWAYDGGDVTVYKADMHTDYFIVRAKNNSIDCPFGYEIIAKQLGYENIRLKEIDNHIPNNTSQYAELYFKDKKNSGE